MSRNNSWLICHKNRLGNNHLTEKIVAVMRRQDLTPKQVAKDIVIPTERVRNWYYRNTGMTALDLILLMSSYDFVRSFIYEILD